MGSGKGNVEYWVAKVQPGKVLFEIEGVDEATAREAFRWPRQALGVDHVREAAGALMSRKNIKERARSLKSLRGKTRAELRDELAELRREQFNLRMQSATGQPARPDQHAKAMGKHRAREDRSLNEMDRAQAGSKA